MECKKLLQNFLCDSMENSECNYNIHCIFGLRHGLPHKNNPFYTALTMILYKIYCLSLTMLELPYIHEVALNVKDLIAYLTSFFIATKQVYG